MASAKHSTDLDADAFPSLSSASASHAKTGKQNVGAFPRTSRGNRRRGQKITNFFSDVKKDNDSGPWNRAILCSASSNYRGLKQQWPRRGGRGRSGRGSFQLRGTDKEWKTDRGAYQKEGSIKENRETKATPRSSNRGRTGKFLPNHLTLKMLRQFLLSDPKDALFDLQQHKEALQSLLESPLDREYTHTLTSLFAKMSKANLTSNKIQVLTLLQGSRFLKEACLRQILETSEGFGFGDHNRAPQEKFVSELLILCENAVELIPSMVWDIPIDALGNYVSRSLMKDNATRQQMRDTVDRLIEARKQFMRESSKKTRSVQYEAPTDDFRSMSINPTAADLSSEPKLFLRPIKKTGGYDDVQTYLDIQFRLFREDFISSLREGIQDLRSEFQNGGKRKPIKVYRGVRILYPLCSKRGIIHRVMFDVSQLGYVKWEHSRRLIFGSLLCFTKDDFRNVKFATVANRDPKELKMGLLDIIFLSGYDDSREYSDKDDLLMAESPSYFEAYRYVAEAMKNIKNEDLPFQEYFVDCKPLSRLPAYLQRYQGFGYDMKSALEIKDSRKSVFSIVESKQWPSVNDVALNGSQLEAMKHALTNEVTLVQGPPGTGKTYLGLRIAHALLVNKNITDIEQRSPMLIVCYTNHALDQFLKGLLELGHKSILRVGSRCRDEALEAYQLRSKDWSRDSRPHARIRRLIFDQNLERKGIAEMLEDEEQFFKSLYRCHLNGKVLPLDMILESVQMSTLRHFEVVEVYSRRIGVSILEVWLGLHPFTVDHLPYIFQGSQEAYQKNSASVQRLEEDVDEDEDGVTIQGEGNVLTDRWAADDDYFSYVNQKSRKNLGKDRERKPSHFIDSEGFSYIPYKKRYLVNMIKEKVSKLVPMSDNEVRNVHNPFHLELDDRWRLYLHWVENVKDKLRNVPQDAIRYNTCCDRISELEMERDRIMLQDTEVVGMTTSCAARYKQCLENLQPKVVIVEEAAEVLEAHVLSSLPRSTQHLILLGDHKQLKPNPSVYKLAKKYNLEVSLFERLINNGVSFKCLNVQHRMRPEIASLISHIYPELQNHPTVEQYDNVRGVACNMFFVDHKHPESEDNDLYSKRNEHEAQFIKALCWYFLQQGYRHSQITVLTMYTGQLLELKRLMPKKQFEGVRVCSVDNFQGEENDIVLLSLVRSNEDRKIGFVGIENRICVALSRARMGLFVIGNFELLESESVFWHRVVQILTESDNIGSHLRLCCSNHPKRQILASLATDFKNAPEGGCSQPCGFRLRCGHSCAKACHPVDPLHQEYTCRKKCELKVCMEGHPCYQQCHDGRECGPCQTRMKKVMPICEHEQWMECCQDPADFSCKAPCEKQLICGHRCKLTCGEMCEDSTCSVLVTHGLPCGHKQDAKCSDSVVSILCLQPCDETLTCGHQCVGTCGKCSQGRLHVPCQYPCERTLICSHICKEKCTKFCPPCNQQCSYRCFHSKCRNQCGEECTPCKERCLWACSHARCTKLCYEECDRERCNEPCWKLLKCHHPCIGLCGEKCPKACRECQKEIVEEIFFGTEDEPDARFIQLHDCKHFFEVTAFDRYMDYQPTSDDSQQTYAGIRHCPKCKTAILRTLRYGNVVKEMMKDVERIKIKIAGLNSLDEIERDREMRMSLDQIEKEIFKLEQLRSPALPRLLDTKKRVGEVLENIGVRDLKLMRDWLSKQRVSSVQRWTDWRNRAASFRRILEISYEIERSDLLEPNQSDNMKKQVICVVKRLQKSVQGQGLADVTLELRRIKLYFDTLDSLNRGKLQYDGNDDIKVLREYHEKFKLGKKISDSELDEVKSFVATFRKKHGMGSITEKERVEILKAVGLPSGHWFKCKNGHLYAIGNCGGAMERSTCPECKAVIGGENHRLAEGNEHAREFDNSRYPAWSEMANLNNFNLNDLHLRD